MNIFFGKISQNFDTTQLQEGYYTAEKGSSWFGELNLGDYVFMIGGGKIQLWKAKKWIDKDEVQEARLDFEIIFDDTKLKVKDLVAFKFFKLSMNLAVKSTRSTASEKKAFFKLEYDANLTEEKILDKSTYTIPENFRSIRSFLPDQPTEQDSYNIQIQFENGKLKLLPIKNCDSEIIDRFKDNIPFIGRGRPNKDKTLRIAKDIKNIGSDLNFSINNFFDAFLCEYNAKIEEVLDKEQNIEPEISNNFTEKRKKMALNQILYGPPGTGKTYNSINKAISILNPKFDLSLERNLIKGEYDRLILDNRILFTTFHQSMTYEDFIEGIKPVQPDDHDEFLKYNIQEGLFKVACANAAYLCYREYQKTKRKTFKYTFDDLYDAFIEKIQALLKNKTPPVYKTLTGKDVAIIEINSNDSIKARAKNSVASRKPAPLTKENLQKLYDKFNTIDEITTLKQVKETVEISPRITEFYAVFGGLKEFENTEFKPDSDVLDDNFNDDHDYNIEEVIKKFNAGVYTAAVKDFGKIADPVVLIIDEINRGNISQIFGELITLIEEDKRLGNNEALEVILPYSKEKFGVPSNLYVIGTMNTADRSVEALDTALRRRFNFVEMMPDSKVVEKKNFNDRAIVMKKINQRVELLLDRNYTLGHSYFIKENFENSFKNEIIPLLQEYFYNDCGKIGLVLGRGFVREKEISKYNNTAVFADFDTKNEVDIIKSYELIPFDEIDFKVAIKTLLV